MAKPLRKLTRERLEEKIAEERRNLKAQFELAADMKAQGDDVAHRRAFKDHHNARFRLARLQREWDRRYTVKGKVQKEMWEPIPIGAKVVILDHPSLNPKCVAGLECVVTGYEKDPPTAITRLRLEADEDVTFRYPTLFPWEVKRVHPRL